MRHSGQNWELHVGDCRKILQELSPGSVQCCVTSPPYWGLRDYQTPPLVWGDWSGSLGMEPTIEMYVRHMVEVFADVWRVLRDNGTLWVNLGDSYASSGTDARGAYSESSTLGKGRRSPIAGRHYDEQKNPVTTIKAISPGLKAKDLCMIPERFAIAMQSAGWYVRSKITWCKKAPMPESCRDRPTTATEMIYLLSKKPHYFYDMDAARMATTTAPHARRGGNYKGLDKSRRDCDRTEDVWGSQSRNLWNYWNDLGQSNFSGAHFATFPLSLPLRCIKLGTSVEGCCPQCGSPWERVLARKEYGSWNDHDGNKDKGLSGNDYYKKHRGPVTTGWQPGCDCDHEPIETGHATVPCTVLDLFSGSHTTGIAALQLGRRYVGIELSEKYASDYAYRLHDPFTKAKANSDSAKTPGFGLNGA